MKRVPARSIAAGIIVLSTLLVGLFAAMRGGLTAQVAVAALEEGETVIVPANRDTVVRCTSERTAFPVVADEVARESAFWVYEFTGNEPPNDGPSQVWNPPGQRIGNLVVFRSGKTYYIQPQHDLAFVCGVGLVGPDILSSVSSSSSSSAATCGGIAGIACPAGLECVDDPSDTCDPQSGGADCMGVCVRIAPSSADVSSSSPPPRPSSSSSPGISICGDGYCDNANGEHMLSCPEDCGEPPIIDTGFCGDDRCDVTESYETCAADCSPPAYTCGDAVCDEANGERYMNCSSDCVRPGGPPYTVEEACDIIRKGGWDGVHLALESLVGIETPMAEGCLRYAMENNTYWDQFALQILGPRQSSTATFALISALDNEDSGIRAKAVLYLAPRQQGNVTEALARRLTVEDDGEVQRALMNALADRGDPHVSTVIGDALLDNRYYNAHLLAVDILGKRYDEISRDRLHTAITSEGTAWTARYAIITVLEKKDDAFATQMLIAATQVQDFNPDFRIQALQALGPRAGSPGVCDTFVSIGINDPRSDIRLLAIGLHDEYGATACKVQGDACGDAFVLSGTVEMTILRAQKYIADRSDASTHCLSALVEHAPMWYTRRDVVQELIMRSGTVSTEGIAYVLKNDEHPTNRRFAVQELANRTGEFAAEDALRYAAENDEDPQIRTMAQEALINIDGLPAVCGNGICEAGEGSMCPPCEPGNPSCSCSFVCERDCVSPPPVSCNDQRVTHGDPLNFHVPLSDLTMQTSDASTSCLKVIAENHAAVWYVRQDAVEALAVRNTSVSTTALANVIVYNDPHHAVRLAAVKALAERVQDPVARRALQYATGDDSSGVRTAAEEALK